MSRSRLLMAAGVCTLLALAAPGWTQVQPPDLSVCTGVDCASVQNSVCSSAGFKIKMTGYDPATTSNNGTATYTYEICSPSAGVCTGSLRAGESCLDNGFCQKKGQDTDPTAQCTRECATDTFRGLSHFDVAFPALGASCLSSTTEVTGSCNASGGATVKGFTLGDGSCFSSTSPVAKCDETSVPPGGCITMTLNIAGENTGLGLGTAVVVDKESTECTASCMTGPSCTRCDEPPEGGQCLTRTIGFWGTHPAIASQYDPVTVCGKVVNGQEPKTCSTSEAICHNATDNKANTPLLSLVAQLTAAQLNLNATNALFSAGCSDFSYQGASIQEWITTCEALCGASKDVISGSGCIEALDAFNNSQDTGFDQTPSPFDKPGPADPTQCQASRGNGKYVPKLCS